MSLRTTLRTVASSLRLPGRTIRLRLALIYGGMFALSGAVLLAVVYLLVRFTFPVAATQSHVRASGGDRRIAPLPSLASLAAQADRQRQADLHQLLIVSGMALAIMLVAAVCLGWVVAGRALRPLRAITAAAREVSSATLDRRLALAGPDDELKELGDTIDALLERLERSFAAQRQFVANASHELRTPLTLERALLEAALTNPQVSEETLRATCRRLQDVNADQERLIEALLTLAISERGIDRPEPLDLADLAGHVVDVRHGEADRHGVRVDTELHAARTHGAPDLIERLIANLLDNAIRYNLPGGRVEVTTGTASGCATLSVCNTGPLIPADRVSELFAPFRRYGAPRVSQDPATQGHGLGLSIVAAVATAHQAELTAVAIDTGGLKVTVRFPPMPDVPASISL